MDIIEIDITKLLVVRCRFRSTIFKETIFRQNLIFYIHKFIFHVTGVLRCNKVAQQKVGLYIKIWFQLSFNRIV